MKKKFASLAVLPFLVNNVEAFSAKVSGEIENFSLIGFNQSKIDVQNNIYPTQTFSSVVAKLQLDMQLLSENAIQRGHSLETGIGGLIGKVVYDSTVSGPGGSQIFNYVGYYEGYLGNQPLEKDHLYVIYNAYLDYNFSSKDGNQAFQIKAGRYASKAQFMSGYTQGFEIDYRYKGLDLWWFSSFGRSFAYGQWVYDFYSPKVLTLSDNRVINAGIHAFKPSYTFQNGLYISPFIYFYYGRYTAPMLELGYDSNSNFKREPGSGFRSKTNLFFLSTIWDESLQKTWRYQAQYGKGGQTLALIQTFYANNYDFGFGYYGNFGNANADIGTYGNAAVGFDFWVNTVYDIGASISNALTKDAQTGYIFAGGVHGPFQWDVLGRLTFSPRADERSVLLSINYAFTKNFKVWARVELQSITVHKGFLITNSNNLDLGQISRENPRSLLQADSKQDRSYAMISVTYNF